MLKKTLYVVFKEFFEAALFRDLKALLPKSTMNFYLALSYYSPQLILIIQ
jgi:hypothetical protein